MTALWSGKITVGLVSIPVDLVTTRRPGHTELRLVAEDGTTLSRRCACHPRGEGLELGKRVPEALEEGWTVVAFDEKPEPPAPERRGEIDLRRFLDREELNPALFRRAYFLAPAGKTTKLYRLLARILEEMDEAGIGTFVLRGRKHRVAIVAEEGCLRAELLRLSGGIRSSGEALERDETEEEVASRSAEVVDFVQVLRERHESGS